MERSCAEGHDAPLILVALAGTLHAGRDGALLKRVLAERDDQTSLLFYVRCFVKEGLVPAILRFRHHCDVEGPSETRTVGHGQEGASSHLSG